jgi:hypothetical protein
LDITEQAFSGPGGSPVEQPATPVKQPEATPKKFSTALAWTPELAKTRYVAVIRGFLEHYSSLRPAITPGEAMFIIHVMSFKWGADAPYPGYKTIAKLMGTSDKMSRRHAQSLQQKGYLIRQPRRAQTNKFDFQPLFVALEAKVAEVARTRRKRRSKFASDTDVS